MKNNYNLMKSALVRRIFFLLVGAGLIAGTANATSISSSKYGGLWTNADTWVGGIVPTAADQVTIVDSSVVTINGVVTVAGLTIGQGAANKSILQWSTASALTVTGNLTINSNGILLGYTTGLAGVTIGLSGNFVNSGVANLALTTLDIRGSVAQTISGAGNFIGDGTNGIIRGLQMSNPISFTISTAQNLILTSTLNDFVGTLNTGGKLSIDNTAQVYGQPLNLSVANVAVTTMGRYTVEPAVFGASATAYVSGASTTLNNYYFNGDNFYLCTAAAPFNASAPTTTTDVPFNTSGPTLLFVGTRGTLGNPYRITLLTIGTQYFYGDNLYTAVNTTAPAAATPPNHTSGVGGPNSSFLYVGTVAKVAVNYDPLTPNLNVRSLRLLSAGSGYSFAPTLAFNQNGGTVPTTAAASVVYIQRIEGAANFATQKGTVANISGALPINSTQGASQFSGVGQIAIPSSSTNGAGVNYDVTNPPKVGFNVPSAATTGTLNLIINQGAGYILGATATVNLTDTAGRLANASIVPSMPTFIATVAGGKVVSVVCTAPGTALWLTLPSLTITAPTGTSPTQATAAFPAGCLPTATATVGTNGQITGFTITNAGFGYISAPTLGFGTGSNSGGGTNLNGQPVTVASTVPTARIAQYNLTYTMNTAVTAVSNPAVTAGAEIPSSGRMFNLTLGNTTSVGGTANVNFASVTLSANLELTAAATAISLPTSGVTSPSILNLGGFTLKFSNPGYAGVASSVPAPPLLRFFGYVTNGPMTLSSIGANVTRTFPFDASVVLTTTNANIPAKTGATATEYTITPQSAPSGIITGATGGPIGTRSYRLTTNGTLGTPGINGTLEGPTITLNYNDNDNLNGSQRVHSIFVGQSASNSGPWVSRSLHGFGNDTLTVYQIGCACKPPSSRTTTQPFAPGPIDLANGEYFSFIATGNSTITSTAKGGLWSDPATWAGGIVPTIADDAIIADGAIVTVDILSTVKSVTVGQGGGSPSILQWNATANAMTITGNLTIASNGKFFPHSASTSPTGVVLRLGGNFTNNGLANLAFATLNFNGSVLPGGNSSQLLNGNGYFIADSSTTNGSVNLGKGIIRTLQLASTGSLTIGTTQSLVLTGGLNAFAGTVNTGGLLRIDNGALVAQQAMNQEVANIAQTNMGQGYNGTPIAWGNAVVLDTSLVTGNAGQVITSGTFVTDGTHVYYCQVATTGGGGHLPGTGAWPYTGVPATDAATFTRGGGTFLYVDEIGAIGTPLRVGTATALTTNNLYFFNGKTYLATSATAAATAPTHTTGLVGNLLYTGTRARVSVNYDAPSARVRSVSITEAGNGYSNTATNNTPAIVFSNGVYIPASLAALGAVPTTAAAATAVFHQQIAGPANSLVNKNGPATISGGLAINNDQGVPAPVAPNKSNFTGVASISSGTNVGLNYTATPLVGFGLPTGLNLVVTAGSGYAAAPVVTVGAPNIAGGTQALATASVAQGGLVSVHITTGGSGYTSLPTISVTGTGTVAFPASCLATATATIGNGVNGATAGQLKFDLTAPGYGYLAAPGVAITSTGATQAASNPTIRAGLYNVQYNNIFPFNLVAAQNAVAAEGAEIPANRKIQSLLFSGNTAIGGLTLNGVDGLQLYGTAPLTLTSGVLNLSGDSLFFPYPGYNGQSGSLNASVTNGSITLSAPGGSSTLLSSSATKTFPFDAPIAVQMGTATASAVTGATFTQITASRAAAPSGAVSPSGSPIGTRSFRVQTPAGTVYGTNPTVALNWNANDALISDDLGLRVVQAAAPTGAWTVRNVPTGTANNGLGATGSKTTGTTAPTLIVPTTDDYYAWASTYAPVPLQYNITRTPNITYNTIMQTGDTLKYVSLSSDEGLSDTINFPFPFSYCGQTVSGIQVQVNGFSRLITPLTPRVTSGSSFTPRFSGPSTLTTVGAGAPFLLAPFYVDQDVQTGTQDNFNTKFRKKLIGTSPNRELIIECFENTPFGAAGAQISYQYVIGEDQSISYRYGLFQAFNGIADVKFNYAIGMSGPVVGFPAQAGQVLVQQYENSNVFSHENVLVAGRSANGLSIAPECNSEIKFTPGPGYTGGTIPSAAAPANDEVASAITVSALSAFPSNLCGTFYSSRYATASTIPGPACAGNNDDDVWFKFTANDPNTIVRIYASGGYVPRVQIYDNAFSSISCKVGIVDLGTPVNATFPGSGVQMSSAITAVPGQVYYVRVYHERGGIQATATTSISPEGAVTAFNIINNGSGYTTSNTQTFGGTNTPRVTLSGGGGRDAVITLATSNGIITGGTIGNGGFGYTSPPTVTIEKPDWSLTGEFALVVFAKAANDECADATLLNRADTNVCVTGLNRITGAVTTAASASVGVTVCNATTAGTPDDDVWYKFEGTGFNKVEVIGSGLFDAVLQVFDGGASPGACIGSAQGCVNATIASTLTTSTTESITLNTTPGNIYYIRVYHAGTGSGGALATHSVCVTSVQPNCILNPTAPLSGTSTCNGSGVTLTWPAAPTATGYDVYLDDGAVTPTTLVSSNQVSTNYTTIGAGGPLSPTGIWSWKVVPRNAFGFPTGCSTWTFTTIDPSLASTTGNTRCGTGSVELLAIGSIGNTVAWYSAPTGGSATVGSVFNTPPISSNATFYAAPRIGSCEGGRTAVLATVTAPPTLTVGPAVIDDCTVTTNALSVTSTLSNYDTYIWTPFTDLYQDAAATLAYNGQNLSTVYVRKAASGTQTYTCTATEFPSLCANTASLDVTLQTQSASISAATTNICATGSTTLTLSAIGTIAPGTIQWQSSTVSNTGPWTNVGSSSTSYSTGTITTTTHYQALVYNAPAGSVCITTNAVTVTVTPQPVLTITSNATVCNGTIVPLTVTSTLSDFNTYLWTPVGHLYTNAGATTSYTGTTASTVYFKDTVSGSYAYLLTATNTITTCSATARDTIVVLPKNIIIDATPDFVCGASAAVSVKLSPLSTYQGGSIQWQTSVDNVSFSNVGVTDSTAYNAGTLTDTLYVRAIIKNSAGDTCEIPTYTVFQYIPQVVAFVDSSRCGPGTVQLSATGSSGATIKWYTASSGGSAIFTGNTFITPVINATTTYYAEASISTCLSTTRQAVTATVTPTTAITATADQTVCNGEIKVLTVTEIVDFDTYTWSIDSSLFSDAAAATLYAGGSTDTVYYKNTSAVSDTIVVFASNSVNYCAQIDTIFIKVLPAASTITSIPDTICVSGTATVKLTPNTGYPAGSIQWQQSLDNVTFSNVGTDSVAYATSTLTDTTYHRALIKNSAGDTCYITPVYTLLQYNPQVVAFADSNRCGTGTVVLNATGSAGATIRWYTAASGGGALFTGASFTTPSISVTTTYYAEASNGTCVGATRQAVVATVNPANALTLSADQSICKGSGDIATVTVTLVGDYDSYIWSPLTNLYTDPAATIAYTGTSANILYIKDTVVGTKQYIVTATNSVAPYCSRKDTTYFSVLPASATISSTPIAICVSDTAVLSLTPSTGYKGGDIQWQSSADNVSFSNVGTDSVAYHTGTVTDTTYYRAIIKNSDGDTCFITSTYTLFQYVPQLLSSAGASRCGFGSLSLTATGSNGTAIRWYSVPIGGNPVFTGSPFNTGLIVSTTTYYVEAAIGTCASARSVVTATVNAVPALTVNTPGRSVCNAAIRTLSVTSPSGNFPTYLWAPADSLYDDAAATIPYTGGNLTTVYAKTSVAGVSAYTVTGSGGICPNTATISDTILPASATITSSPASICVSGTAVLKLNPTQVYPSGNVQWQDSPDNGVTPFANLTASFDSTITTAVLTDTNYYRAIVKNSANATCFTTASFLMPVVNPQVATFTPGTRCSPGRVTLSATAPAGNISWFVSPTAAFAAGVGTSFLSDSIFSTTIYYVGLDLNACAGTRVPVAATIIPAPPIIPSPAQTVCNGSVALLTISNLTDFDSLVWTPTTNLFFNAGGTVPYVAGRSADTVYFKSTVSNAYTITVNGSNPFSTGCYTSAITIVSVQPSGATLSASPATICIGGSSTISLVPSTVAIGSIVWQQSPDSVTFTTLTGALNTTYTTIAQSVKRYYRAIVNSSTGTCDTTAIIAVNVNNPTVSNVVNVSRCGPGAVTLHADSSAGATVSWFQTPISTGVLGSGNNFTTPVLLANTTYYVSASISGCAGGRKQVLVTVTGAPTLAVTDTSFKCNLDAAVLTNTSVLAGTFNKFEWAPLTNLYRNAAGTIPYLGYPTHNDSLVYVVDSTSGNQTYTFTAEDTTFAGGCRNVDTTNVTTYPATIALIASPGSFCRTGGLATITVAPVAGVSFVKVAWETSSDSSTWIPTGTTGASYTSTVSANTYFRAKLLNSLNAVCAQTDIAVKILDPLIVNSADASRCGIGTVTLSATGSAGTTLNWYTNATGGFDLSTIYTPVTVTGFNDDIVANSVGLPVTTTTAAVDATNNFLCDQTFQLTIADPLPLFFLPAGGVITDVSNSALNFNLASYSASNSLRLSASGQFGTLTIGTPQPAQNINLLGFAGSGAATIDVEVTFTDASTETFTGLQLKDWFNQTPFVTSGFGRCSSTGPDNASGTTNPRMYNVVLNLNPANYLKLAQSLKVTRTTTTVSGNIVNIMAVTLGSKPASSTYTTPVISATTTYYVAASAGQGLGAGTFDLGLGAVVNTTTTYPTPYGNSQGAAHEQYLIRASELTALGVFAGPITSLAFDLASAYTGANLKDFKISIATTTATTMSTFIGTGFTTVYYAPGQVTAPALGWNNYPFSSAFIWDGTSNIVIDVNFSNCTLCNGTSSCPTTSSVNGIVRQSATSFVSSRSLRASSNCTINSFAPVGGTVGTASQRPNMQFNANVISICETSPRVAVTAFVTPGPAVTTVVPDYACNNEIVTMRITSSVDSFDTYVWTPVTGLYTDAAATIPYVAGTNTDTVYVKDSIAGIYIYTVLATDTVTGCASQTKDTIIYAPAALNGVAAPANICKTGTSNLTIGQVVGFVLDSIQWQDSPDSLTWTDVAGARGRLFTTPVITASRYYRAIWIKPDGSDTCLTKDFLINVNTPLVAAVYDSSRCGIGTVMLRAAGSPNTSLTWFANATGGTSIAAGDTFVTPTISVTDTFYVVANTSGSLQADGLGANIVPTASGFNAQRGIQFTATQPFTLLSAQVFYAFAGTTNVTVELRNSANVVLQTVPVTIVTTDATPAFHTMTLNIPVTPGTNYKLLAQFNSGSLSNFSHSTGANYAVAPWNNLGAAGVITAGLNGATTVESTSYWYFYNISLTAGCSSDRVPVVATVDAPPALTVSDTTRQIICNGDIKALSVSSTLSNYNSYRWSPITGLYSNAAATIPYTGTGADTTLSTVYVKDTVVGTRIYTVLGGNSAAPYCTNVATDTIVTLPASVSISASPASLCFSGAAVLTVSNSPGFTYTGSQWQESLDSISWLPVGPADTTFYRTDTISATRYYRTFVLNSAGDTCLRPVYSLIVYAPAVGITADGTRCGIGSVNLTASTATPGATLNWFANATGGAVLGTGSPFATPQIY